MTIGLLSSHMTFSTRLVIFELDLTSTTKNELDKKLCFCVTTVKQCIDAM